MKALETLKQQVFDANLELVRRGLVLYTWGNVSAIDRANGYIVIKPRGIAYQELEAQDMSVVDLEGQPVEKGLLPSVDLDIHLALYRRFPEIGGIAHTHSTWATAWAQAGQSIPVLGTTHADHFYGSIPCTRRMTSQEVESDYERCTGQTIIEALQERKPLETPGVLAAGHGPFTWGATPQQAVENSVILEELAKIAQLTLDLNPHSAELDSFVVEKHFCRKHGSSAYFYQTK